MKLLPLVIIILFIIGAGSASFASYIQDDLALDLDSSADTEVMDVFDTDGNTDEAASSSHRGEPPVPDFLAHYMDSTWWGIDTICVVNGKAYLLGYDEYGRTCVIFTDDELLCEDPTLDYDSVASNLKTTFQVSTITSTITVDFADRNSVAQLKTLMPQFENMNRFRKDYFSDCGMMVLYHMDIDVPKHKTASDEKLCKWLVKLVNQYLNFSGEMSLLLEADRRLYNKQHKTYKGSIRDTNALGRFASKRYFALKKLEYGDDRMEYPVVLNQAFSLRLVSSNGKYFSYQQCTYDYSGGAHGYFTQEIFSFVPSSNEEIDWNWLFKPNCRDAVLDLFYHVVQKNSKYKRFENTNSIAEIRENFEVRFDVQNNGYTFLSQPGLTDEGVMFSFQPYELSCFAAGCFHFTIPYKDLKPYMTAKAIQLLNL